MRTRRAELTWTVAGLGLVMMSFVVVAEHWEAPASVVWTVLPLLFIAAAVVLTWLRVNTIGGALEEVRRISVAASNAQLKTDERVAALGVRVVTMSNHQMAMVAILRRAYPAAEEEPTQPGRRPAHAAVTARAVLLAGGSYADVREARPLSAGSRAADSEARPLSAGSRAADSEAEPLSGGARAGIGDPEAWKRTQKHRRRTSPAVERPQLPAPDDDLEQQDDDPTRVYRASDLDLGGDEDGGGSSAD